MPAVPRSIAPLSTSIVTSRRPLLAWRLTGALDGAEVELCRDRAMTASCLSFETTGSTGAPSADLAAGAWFWRLRGREGTTLATTTGPVWEFFTGTRSASVNTAAGSVLDANGDGRADLLVGTNYNQGAYLHVGTASGPDTEPTTSFSAPDGAQYFGSAVANAGDVNGDGFGDLVVGDYFRDNVYIYFGSALGPSTTAITLHLSASLSFGHAVAGAGDINRDGYGDLVIGANNANGAFVYLGGPTGPGTSPATSLAAPAGYAGLGGSVAGAGDVNGDGYADLVVATNEDNGPYPSAVFVYHGGSAGVAALPTFTLMGAGGSAFGSSVDSAGDVNGDGYSDLVIGAYHGNGYRGEAYVYLGSRYGIDVSSASHLAVAGTTFFGASVSGAGDVNGDGYSDVVVGQRTGDSVYVYLGTASNVGTSPAATLSSASGRNFGAAVGGAGDVDGDGYADVAVGAWNENSGSGSVRVFPGAAGGTRSTPWSTLLPPFGVTYFGYALSRAP